MFDWLRVSKYSLHKEDVMQHRRYMRVFKSFPVDSMVPISMADSETLLIRWDHGERVLQSNDFELQDHHWTRNSFSLFGMVFLFRDSSGKVYFLILFYFLILQFLQKLQ